MKNFFLFLTLFTYIISFIGFCFALRSYEEKIYKLVHKILFLGIIFHIFLVFFSFSVKFFSFSFFFYFISIELILIYFYFYLRYPQIYFIGFITLSIVIIFLIGSFTPIGKKTLSFDKNLLNFWLFLHSFSSLVSHGFFIFGLIVSLVYLFQEKELKEKKLKFFFERLPSLSLLDFIMERCLELAFVFLTFGLILGIIWNQNIYKTYFQGSPKEIASILLWVLYAVLIHQRRLIGWRGKKIVYAFLIGFIIWFISIFIINFFTKGFHTYG